MLPRSWVIPRSHLIPLLVPLCFMLCHSRCGSAWVRRFAFACVAASSIGRFPSGWLPFGVPILSAPTCVPESAVCATRSAYELFDVSDIFRPCGHHPRRLTVNTCGEAGVFGSRTAAQLLRNAFRHIMRSSCTGHIWNPAPVESQVCTWVCCGCHVVSSV